MGPEMRPSRPTTIRGERREEGGERRDFFSFLEMNVAYAVVNLTMSKGLRVSPVRPPIVPRMPEIDFISVIIFLVGM
jgi:hypothetical protein